MEENLHKKKKVDKKKEYIERENRRERECISIRKIRENERVCVRGRAERQIKIERERRRERKA
jgi:hypothetical protein